MRVRKRLDAGGKMSSATLWIKIGGSAALLAVAVLAGYLAQIDFMRRRKDMLSMANVCEFSL